MPIPSVANNPLVRSYVDGWRFLCSGKDPYSTLRKQTAEATQYAVSAGINLVREQQASSSYVLVLPLRTSCMYMRVGVDIAGTPACFFCRTYECVVIN